MTPHGNCRLLALQMPRSWLRVRLPAAESQIMTPIAAGYSPALGLAMTYANILLKYDINRTFRRAFGITPSELRATIAKDA